MKHSYIRKKHIHGGIYYYHIEPLEENGKVKQTYLGTADDIKRKVLGFNEISISEKS